MTLIKQTEVPWTYPIIAFLLNGDLRYFDYPLPLSEFPQWVYNDGVLMGMELIDDEGEQWFVRTVDRTSPEPPRRRWWQIWPFWEEPHAFIELGLEKGGQVDFERVRQRVCDWHEASMRPDGDLRQLNEEILDCLRNAKNLEEIGDITATVDLVGFFG